MTVYSIFLTLEPTWKCLIKKLQMLYLRLQSGLLQMHTNFLTLKIWTDGIIKGILWNHSHQNLTNFDERPLVSKLFKAWASSKKTGLVLGLGCEENVIKKLGLTKNACIMGPNKLQIRIWIFSKLQFDDIFCIDGPNWLSYFACSHVNKLSE